MKVPEQTVACVCSRCGEERSFHQDMVRLCTIQHLGCLNGGFFLPREHVPRTTSARDKK